VFLMTLQVMISILFIVYCQENHRSTQLEFDPDTGMLEWVNLMKLKCADQRFGLRYKPKKDDYKQAIKIKRKGRMTKVK